MANVQFTINNISANTVTYQGQPILSGANFTPSVANQRFFASDPGVIADLLSNTITLSIGSYTWSGQTAVHVLSFTTLASSEGTNNTVAPTFSNLIGGSDGTNIVPIAVDTQGRLVTSSLTGFGSDFSFGRISTAATTRVPVRRTAYTEQTTDGQRSIASSSVNDTAAGTGARTLLITYLDQTGAGPFTETLTLNGTSRVNTVASNICFIEQMEVLTAGSTGSNVGIITLYTVPTAGGSAIGTIAATDNQTGWAHHYVPVDKTCNITGISCGGSGTTVGSGALFTLNGKSLTLSNAIETQVSDFVRLYGQSSTFSRAYSSPIKVLGPARLQMYITPETGSATTYYGAFDFFEP